jgi:multidrug efflux system membrane fusion protein
MRLLLTTRPGATVVPAQVVQRGPQGNYVYVVKPDQTAEMRTVTTGPVEAGQMVIETGLQEGEVVVRDGMAKLQPGGKVALAEQGGAAKGAEGQGGGEAPHQHARKDGEKQAKE